MLRWHAAAAPHEGRHALRDLAHAAHWVERVARTLLVLLLWPLIYGVLAMIAGVYGWHDSAVGADGVNGQLFALMLTLFILVMSQALVGRDCEP